jgi:hypothetical protein
MLNKADITDIIYERLRSGAEPARTLSRASAPLPKRVFISDWELKKLIRPGQKTIRVPANSIISPLSEDWLDYDGVKIILV